MSKEAVMECVAFHKEQTKKTIDLLTKFGAYLTKLDYEMYMSEFGGCPEAMNDPDNVPKRKAATSDDILGELAKELYDIREEDEESTCYEIVKDFVDEFMVEMTCAHHDNCEECEYHDECMEEDDDEDNMDEDTLNALNKFTKAMGVEGGEIHIIKVNRSKPE